MEYNRQWYNALKQLEDRGLLKRESGACFMSMFGFEDHLINRQQPTIKFVRR